MRVAALIGILGLATCGPRNEPTVSPDATPAAVADPTPADGAPATSHFDRVLVKLAEGTTLESFRSQAGSLPASLLEARDSILGWSLLTFAPTTPPRGAAEQAALVDALRDHPLVREAAPEDQKQAR